MNLTRMVTVVMATCLLCIMGPSVAMVPEESNQGNIGSVVNMGQTDDGTGFNVMSNYGRRVPVPTSDKAVIRTARWSAEQLGGCLISIQSAEKQIVAGLKYFIHLTLVRPTEGLNCVYNMHCYVVVWTRTWLHSRRLMNFRCTEGDTQTCP